MNSLLTCVASRRPIRFGMRVGGLLILIHVFVMVSVQAAEDPSWSSGVYRLDPGRNPFRTPSEKPQSDYRDQWWQQERLPRSTRERYAPRIWEQNEEKTTGTRKQRPWGEIPSQWEDPDPTRRERPPYNDDRPFYNEDRYQERPPPRDRYWDGPYQRDAERDYHDRDPNNDRYRDPYNGQERYPRRQERRNRYDTWDPWERDPPYSPWER